MPFWDVAFLLVKLNFQKSVRRTENWKFKKALPLGPYLLLDSGLALRFNTFYCPNFNIFMTTLRFFLTKNRRCNRGNKVKNLAVFNLKSNMLG
jgi:hypothetical protein